MILLLLTYVLILFAGEGVAQAPGNAPSCREVHANNGVQLAHQGWPYKIKCALFVESVDYSAYNWLEKGLKDDDNLLCVIKTSNGTVMFNESEAIYSLDDLGLVLPDLKLMGPHEYHLKLQATRTQQCLLLVLRLNVIAFQPRACSDLSVQSSVAVLGSRFVVHCSDYGMKPEVYAKSGLEYYWEKNCLNSTLKKGKELVIPSMTLDDEGVYTCFVTYKGMKRLVISERITANCPFVRLLSKPSLTCSDEVVQRRVGEEVVVKCNAVIGKDQPTPFHFLYRWKKELQNEDQMDFQRCGRSDKADRSQRILCEYDIIRRSPTNCKGASAIVPLRFRISKITEKDFGTYVLEVQTILRTPNGRPRVNQTFILQQNKVPEMLRASSFLGLGISLTSLALVLLIIVIYRVLIIRVCLKRHCGMYTEDNKKYGAYLAYTYSQDHDVFSQQLTREAVRSTRSSLEGMGYRIFDASKDWSNGYNKAEHIQTVIQKSHRVVIFLTVEFIKDAWSMSALQKGFDEMINSGIKLIFIIFPGILEYLQQHQRRDDCCLMIQRAIQLGYAIRWTNDVHFNKVHFNLQLEEAMPKLRSQKQKQFPRLSTSSSEMSPCSYRGAVFKRCISNETDVTELDFQGAEDTPEEANNNELQSPNNVLQSLKNNLNCETNT